MKPLSARSRRQLWWIQSIAIFAGILVVILATGPYGQSEVRDFVRTLVAAFVGAYSAFRFNLQVQRENRERDERAAGNHVQHTLRRQFSAFVNARRHLREEIDRSSQEAPGVPLWLTLKPLLHSLPQDTVDFRPLIFLYEDPANVDAMDHIEMAQATYRTFLGALNRFNDASLLKQERLQAAGVVREDQAITLQRAKEIVGPKLQRGLEVEIDGLRQQCDEDEQLYLRASALLHEAMLRRFGPRGLIRFESSKVKEPNRGGAPQSPQAAGNG